MKKYKNNARMAGILFILGFAGVPSAILLPPLTASTNILQAFATNSAAVQISAFAIFIMGFACTGIAIALYPAMKEQHPGMALAAVIFRAIEGVYYIFMGSIYLLMLTVSKMQDATLLPIMQILSSAAEIIIIGQTICWVIGAFLYYFVFYLNQYIPRWLSIWGCVGLFFALFAVVGGYIFNFGADSTLNSILNLPIFFQELVFAGWLIIKGFHINKHQVNS